MPFVFVYLYTSQAALNQKQHSLVSELTIYFSLSHILKYLSVQVPVFAHSLAPVSYEGAEKSHGNNISQLSTVYLADDKTLHSDTSVLIVDTAYRLRKLVFTVKVI